MAEFEREKEKVSIAPVAYVIGIRCSDEDQTLVCLTDLNGEYLFNQLETSREDIQNKIEELLRWFPNLETALIKNVEKQLKEYDQEMIPFPIQDLYNKRFEPVGITEEDDIGRKMVVLHPQKLTLDQVRVTINRASFCTDEHGFPIPQRLFL